MHTKANKIYCCCLVAKSYSSSAIPWTVARQAPLFMGFSRQEYWSELPFTTPGDISHAGIECVSWISCLGRQTHYHCTTCTGLNLGWSLELGTQKSNSCEAFVCKKKQWKLILLGGSVNQGRRITWIQRAKILSKWCLKVFFLIFHTSKPGSVSAFEFQRVLLSYSHISMCIPFGYCSDSSLLIIKLTL